MDQPYGRIDVWHDTTLQPGDLIAVGVPGTSGFAVPIGRLGDLDAIVAEISAIGARDWFESVQVAPKRIYGEGDPIPQPTMRQEIQILQVREVEPAARSMTEANTQFGHGGRDQVYVHSENPKASALDDRDRFRAKATIELDPQTLPARKEDPLFRAVDPSLPDKPLDPRHERNVGRARGAAGVAAVSAADAESPGASP